MNVVGLDLSLTASGVALVNVVGDVHVTTVRSSGKKDATLLERGARLRRLSGALAGIAGGADLVVVEQPAFNAKGGHAHDRSGLWWLVVHELLVAGVPVTEVTPGSVKLYATGKGNAGKDEVLAAVVRRYPDAPVSNNNEADALVLAAIGARHLGAPLEERLPARNLEALQAVHWS